MQCFRERELIMTLVNRLSGNRVHYSMNVIGGVKRDIGPEQVKDVEVTMKEVRPRLEELQRVFRRDSTLGKRTHGVGRFPRPAAESWATVGPVSRASGIPRDIRQDGFAAYSEVRFTPIVREEADVYARMMVRMDECLQSVDIIEECLPLLPDGPAAVQVKGHPTGEAFSRVEAPRGELMYYIEFLVKFKDEEEGGSSQGRAHVLHPRQGGAGTGPHQAAHPGPHERAGPAGDAAGMPAGGRAGDSGLSGPLHMLHGPVIPCPC